MAQGKWLILASLHLDSGTQRFSKTQVRKRIGSPPTSTEYVYEGRLIDGGTIDKSIPILAGLPQIADATIRVADTDLKLRSIASLEPLRRKKFDIRIGREHTSEASFETIFTGEVMDAEAGPGYFDIKLRDKQWAWLDEPIPALIIKDIYDYVSPKDEGGFMPLIFGYQRTPEETPVGPRGMVPCPHIGFPDGPYGVDRFCASTTPVVQVRAVFRRETVTVNNETESEWIEVPAEEYAITLDLVGFERFGLTINPLYIDFFEAQPEGTEIRADIDGIEGRGPWGTLPAIEPSSPPAPTRNAIDHFINMMFYVMAKVGLDSEEEFDTVDICALRTKFQTLGYKSDFATVAVETNREWLGKFLSSHNLRMFQKRNGKLTLNFIDESDPDRPLFSEGRLIVKNTFKEKLPDEVATQVVYRYQRWPTEKRWQSWGIADTVEQEVLGVDDPRFSPASRIPQIEKDVFDLWCISDAQTAAAIVKRRIRFMALGSFKQEFEVPLPPTMADVELAKLIGIRHRQGMAPGGYSNAEVMIYQTTAHLRQKELKYTLRTILRVPRRIGDVPLRPESYYIDLGEAIIYNPTSPFADAHGYTGTSDVQDPELAIDFGSGAEDTFAYLRTRHTSGVAEPSDFYLFRFPEPLGEIIKATIFVTTEYLKGGATVETVHCGIYDGIGGSGVPSTGDLDNFGPGIDRAKETHSADILAVNWPGVENVYVKFNVGTSIGSTYYPFSQYRIYDCWIEYTYAP